MYRTILVDDEQTIRQGLKKIIDWAAMGFEIVDEAENGLVAYDKIQAQKPDLIILDIKMPGMDGVTLLKKLRASGVDARAIFLTGFAEFDYAKRAIELGVEAFLTKPFDEIELKNVLLAIGDRLTSKRAIEAQLASEKRLKTLQLHRRLLLGEKSMNDDLDLTSGYRVVEVQSNAPIHDFNHFFDQFQEDHPNLLCLMIAGNWVIIYKNMSLTRMKVMIHDLNLQLGRQMNCRHFISVGRHVQGQHELYQSFEDVRRLGQKWYLTNDAIIVFFDDQASENSKDFTLDSDLLYSYIEVGNPEGIKDYLTMVSSQFKTMTISFSRVRGLCVSSVLLILEKVKFHCQGATSGLPDSDDIMQDLFEQENLTILIHRMKFYLDLMTNHLHTGNRDNTLYRVLDYIDMHYDKPIRLERLGTIFGYNSSYLGTIFKQHTGMSFKHYLDSVRIEMAKKLLREGHLKVYEVAEMVGYSNVDYFHAKFKKYEHMSPKKFQLTCKEQ